MVPVNAEVLINPDSFTRDGATFDAMIHSGEIAAAGTQAMVQLSPTTCMQNKMAMMNFHMNLYKVLLEKVELFDTGIKKHITKEGYCYYHFL